MTYRRQPLDDVSYSYVIMTSATVPHYRYVHDEWHTWELFAGDILNIHRGSNDRDMFSNTRVVR